MSNFSIRLIIMNNKKKSISNNLITTNNNNNIISKNNDNISNKEEYINFTQIKSVDGYNCIGPCYPSNTIYYNPLTLTFIKSSFPSCPIKKREITLANGNKTTIYADKCNDKDINKGFIFFDIFNDSSQIAISGDMFLKQIYNINNISDVIIFLNSSFDILPLYSQRRILKAIFEVYYKYIEFPKSFFSKKIIQILKQIYKLNVFDEKIIIIDLDEINSKSYDIYKYFLKKYSK